MKILGIIPARYESSRFPGKPLALIGDRTMIRRVYEQSVFCKELDQVIVATDDERIRKEVESFGGNVMMTSREHNSGTERCREVAVALKEAGFDAIINIQGDEPFIQPEQITQLAGMFQDKEVNIATLRKEIKTGKELTDPNVVKVICDNNRHAIYFSRQPLPFRRGSDISAWLEQGKYYKHVGLYGYRPDTLDKIVSLRESELEKAESLEQLRWIENGFVIQVAETTFENLAIDTPADLLKITNIAGQ